MNCIGGKMINIIRHKKCIVFLTMIVLLSGCLEQKTVPETRSVSEQVLRTPIQTESVKTIPIERISNELDMLRSKGWGELSGQLGRTKTTTCLLYTSDAADDLTRVDLG